MIQIGLFAASAIDEMVALEAEIRATVESGNRNAWLVPGTIEDMGAVLLDAGWTQEGPDFWRGRWVVWMRSQGAHCSPVIQVMER